MGKPQSSFGRAWHPSYLGTYSPQVWADNEHLIRTDAAADESWLPVLDSSLLSGGVGDLAVCK